MGPKPGHHTAFRRASGPRNFITWLAQRYDLIVARFALEHIKQMLDVQRAVNHARTLLRPGGSFAAIEYAVIGQEHVPDEVWRAFRGAELATYARVNAHALLGLEPPRMFCPAGFVGTSPG